MSPDGGQVAFVVARVDMEENKYRSQVWLASADGSTPPHPVTSGEHDSSPTWSPDGALAGVHLEARREEGRDARCTSCRSPRPARCARWRRCPTASPTPSSAPTARGSAFTSRTRDERYDAEDESWQAPRKVERFFGRLDSEGWVVRPPAARVRRARPTAPRAPRNLTPGEFQHDGIAWTPDSSASSRRRPAPRHMGPRLRRRPLLGRARRRRSTALTKGRRARTRMPSVSPDGDTSRSSATTIRSTYPQNVHVGVVPVEAASTHGSSARPRPHVRDHGRAAARRCGSTTTTLLATAEDRGETHIYRVGTDGSAPARITSGADHGEGVRRRRRHHRRGHRHGRRAWPTSSSSTDGEPRRLTDFAARYARRRQPQNWERFAVPSTDGTVEIDAWIMRPADFDPAQTYPVLLNVHGGPHTQYGETIFDEAQFQAAAGFVVVMCNPRGGSGREQSWGQSILGPQAPGRTRHRVGQRRRRRRAGRARRRARPLPVLRSASGSGMQGGSYGGFMATWLAGRHGDRFKAICSERAVNNMLSEEWSSDIGSVFRVEHGPAYIDDPEAYTSISPDPVRARHPRADADHPQRERPAAARSARPRSCSWRCACSAGT